MAELWSLRGSGELGGLEDLGDHEKHGHSPLRAAGRFAELRSVRVARSRALSNVFLGSANGKKGNHKRVSSDTRRLLSRRKASEKRRRLAVELQGARR